MPGDGSRFEWPDGRRGALSLTFDDARPSQLDVGLPVLDARGLCATFYVSFGNLEARAAEWRSAAARGHEIGNHSLHHPCSGNFPWSRHAALEEYTLEQMDAELAEAGRRIEAVVGVKPESYAYPCGQKFVGRGPDARSYVPLVARRFLAGRGFRDETPNDPLYCDLARLMAIDGDGMRFDECRSWLERTLQAGGWLVTASHEVGGGGFQTTLRDTLERVCDFCSDPSNGLWMAPVREVARWVLARRGEPAARTTP